MSGNCGGGGGGGNGGGQGNDCFAKVRSTPSWKHRHTHFAPLCLYIHKHLRKLRVWMASILPLVQLSIATSLRLQVLTCFPQLPCRTGPQASSDATAVCATKNDGSCFSAAFSDALAKCEPIMHMM